MRSFFLYFQQVKLRPSTLGVACILSLTLLNSSLLAGEAAKRISSNPDPIESPKIESNKNESFLSEDPDRFFQKIERTLRDYKTRTTSSFPQKSALDALNDSRAYDSFKDDLIAYIDYHFADFTFGQAAFFLGLVQEHIWHRHNPMLMRILAENIEISYHEALQLTSFLHDWSTNAHEKATFDGLLEVAVNQAKKRKVEEELADPCYKYLYE